MAGKVVKVAITIPQEEYREVEAIRRRLGVSRSTVILHALESWLAARRELALDRKYRAAYPRRPETKAEVEAQRALVSQMLASEASSPSRLLPQTSGALPAKFRLAQGMVYHGGAWSTSTRSPGFPRSVLPVVSPDSAQRRSRRSTPPSSTP